MSVRPAKTQITWATAQSDQSLRCPHEESLGPLLPTERTAKTQISLGIQRRLWSDWADAQADLSLRLAHTHFIGFVMRLLISNISTNTPPEY